MTIKIYVMSSDHLPLYCLVPNTIYIQDCEIVLFSQFTPVFSGECVAESLAFCVVFVWTIVSIFVVFHWVIVLSVLLLFTPLISWVFILHLYRLPHIFLIIIGFSFMLLFLEIYVYSADVFIWYKSIHSFLIWWKRNVRLI